MKINLRTPYVIIYLKLFFPTIEGANDILVGQF